MVTLLQCLPVCCHLFVVGIVYLSEPDSYMCMLAGVFILLLGLPKPDRFKDIGQTK